MWALVGGKTPTFEAGGEEILASHCLKLDQPSSQDAVGGF